MTVVMESSTMTPLVMVTSAEKRRPRRPWRAIKMTTFITKSAAHTHLFDSMNVACDWGFTDGHIVFYDAYFGNSKSKIQKKKTVPKFSCIKHETVYRLIGDIIKFRLYAVNLRLQWQRFTHRSFHLFISFVYFLGLFHSHHFQYLNF